MAFFFNGATHVLSRSGAALQTWPLTIHGLIRLTANNDGLDHCILGFWESGANNGFRLMVASQAGSMKVRVATKASGAASSASSTTAISDLNWHSAVGEITAANARQCWLDNAGNGSGTTSLTPGTLTKTTIGAQDSGGTIDSNIGHELANVAAWAGTLTADERAALAAGVSPLLIRPDILVLYLPGIRDAVDYMDAPFSVTGATVVDHPRVYMPSRAQQLVKTAASTGINGTASITEAGDTSAAVGTVALAAAASITEAADTVSSASTLALAGVASITEAGDTSSSTSTLAIAAALAATEAGDTSSATGTLAIVIAAVLGGIEADDTIEAMATMPNPYIWTTIAPYLGTWGEVSPDSGTWTPSLATAGTWANSTPATGTWANNAPAQGNWS